MNLEECYACLGGNYQDILKRLSTDELIIHFLIKFLSDESYDMLRMAIETSNYEEAFKAAHTLKGVSQNLSFHNLATSSGLLTECLRHSKNGMVDKEQCMELFKQVTNDYNKVICTINRLQK